MSLRAPTRRSPAPCSGLMYAGVPTTAPVLGQARVLVNLPARDAEVGHQGVAIRGEEQVLRLDVTVDHAMLVGILEGLRRLAGDPHRLLHRQLAVSPDAVTQRFAIDERHGEPEVSGGIAGVVNGQYMGVLEAGGGLDLPLKAAWTQREGQLRMEHLKGDRALVPEVVGQKHGGHAAAAKLAFEPVSVGQAALELLAQVSHPRPCSEGEVPYDTGIGEGLPVGRASPLAGRSGQAGAEDRARRNVSLSIGRIATAFSPSAIASHFLFRYARDRPRKTWRSASFGVSRSTASIPSRAESAGAGEIASEMIRFGPDYPPR